MNPTLNVLLAGSRERELRTISGRPDRLLARTLQLEGLGRGRTGRHRRPTR